MDFRGSPRKDEKDGLLGQTIDLQTPIKAPQKHRRWLPLPHATILGLVLLFWWSFSSISSLVQIRLRPQTNGRIATENVDFADITPSEKLEWHPCFYNHLCARLTVPMDYNRPLNESSDNPKVHIALLMVPGKHPIWEKHSKSPLLINPGGPGGPGTLAAMAFGPYIQKIVGEDQDVIGFDPRGIGATTPRADCFSYPAPGDPDNEDQDRGFFHRMLWQVQGTEVGLVNSSSDSLAKLDTRARALAKLCQDKDDLHGKDSILRYVSTPAVARDMISIIDAWDEWMETESQSKTHCHEPDGKVEKEAELSEQERHDVKVLDTKGKLVYWGFSYGTLLGATFAAMFPGRVGRVVLDGVVDADHYVSPIWAESVQDTDAIMDSFSTYCHEAKDKCPMYKDGDKPEDIDNRLNGVLERIRETPLTFSNQQSNVPVVIKYSDLKSLLFSTLYSPTAVWTLVASIFNELAEGHDEILQNLVYFPELPLFCGSLLPYWAYPSDAQAAIMCSDKRYPLNETLPNLEKRFKYMANMSSFADVWMGLMVGCDSWGIEAVDPPMRWDDHPAHKQKPINTSFPVLFVSNTLDPVTPLAAGVAMARKFVDAGLIEQHSEGHCSLSAVSKCTINKLREYFLLGKVPSHPSKLEKGEWEKCKADEWPFHPFKGDPFTAESEEARAETERMTAFKQMQLFARRMNFWGPKGLKLNLNLAAEIQEEVARAGLPHFL